MPTIYAANDGVYYKSAPTYLVARDATTAQAGFNNATQWYYHYIASTINMRTFHAFDTSAISLAPSSATISFYGNAFGGAYSSRLVKSTAPVDLVTGMTTANYNDIVGFVAGASMAGNVTDYSDIVTNWVNYTWMVYTLNAAALADIASQNVFSVCNVNYAYDYLNVAPTSTQYPHGYFAGAGGTPDVRPKFDYVAGIPADPPVVTSISPARSLTTATTSVTIIGTDFVATPSVTVGGTAATGESFVDATEITATTPVGTAGAKDVVVTNPDMQDDTLAGGFTYVEAYDNKIIGIASETIPPGGGGSGTEYSTDTDGYVRYAYGPWSTVRDASVGTLAVSGEDNAGAMVRGEPGGPWLDEYEIRRLFMAFDSSGITGPVASATLKLYGLSYPGSAYINNGYIVVRATAPSLASDLTTSDYNNWTTTTYSSATTTYASLSYFSITLNSTALTNLESYSTFKLAIIDHAYDYSDVNPGGGAGDVHFWMEVYMRDYGTSRAPKIEYTLATIPGEPGYSGIIDIVKADIYEINDT